MKQLIRRQDRHRHHNDVCEIIAAMRRCGFIISYHDAVWAWEMYSESLCAGWMVLPEADTTVAYNILHYFDEQEVQ